MHGNDAFLHVHVVLHPFRQPHLISSLQTFEASGRSVQKGAKRPSARTQPQSVGTSVVPELVSEDLQT